MSEQFANDPGTTLSAAILSTARPVTFSVTSGAGWPAIPQFRVILGSVAASEILLVTAVNGGNSYTGTTAEGSTPQTWVIGTAASHVFTAGAIQQLKLDIGSVTATVQTIAWTASPTIDLSLGPYIQITLAGATTPSFINIQSGLRYCFKISQDATGGRTWTWPASVKGGMLVGSVLSTRSVQEFNSFDTSNLWAVAPGIVNI